MVGSSFEVKRLSGSGSGLESKDMRFAGLLFSGIKDSVVVTWGGEGVMSQLNTII